MSLEELKIYLSNRINTQEILKLTDAELNAYFVTAQNIINLLFDVTGIADADLLPVIGEEVIFLYRSDIDLNLFYEYEGLSSFNIAGAVAGSVNYNQEGALYSTMVRLLLKKLGINPVIDVGSGHTTLFAAV